MIKIGMELDVCVALVVNIGMDILAKDVGEVKFGAESICAASAEQDINGMEIGV